MIRHQNIGMYGTIELLSLLFEGFKITPVILLGIEAGAAVVAALVMCQGRLAMLRRARRGMAAFSYPESLTLIWHPPCSY
jgi:hypothetical protein